MAKSYQLLRNKMSPESRKRAQELAQQLREEMRLAELCKVDQVRLDNNVVKPASPFLGDLIVLKSG
jgi:hypothetical protein